ncbi:hypothetical protein TESG_05103 [Trichophyton tonsurans CBS 112818]|uniref:Uncharacterized protein n=1 Tax=Trichophyton tonsurans (strain CBS 112818) TaxID=647933 RepID=F2S2A2_TRIT1|nr:hypothetical protein TESG_05103 [Trichophyton tonsurans CBS 112818]
MSLHYEKTWENSCFTSFTMLEYILNNLNIELDTFITGNVSISREQMRVVLENTPAIDLRPLWKGGTGRCTSFAIHVASRMKDDDPSTIFHFVELEENHRACFTSTGIIIDSSARKLLQTKNENPVSGNSGLWKLDASTNTLFFKSTKTSGFIPFKPLSGYIEAIHHCILQLCGENSFLCLFRVKHNSHNKSNGRLIWQPSRRQLSWSQYLHNETTKKDQFYELSVDFSNPSGDEGASTSTGVISKSSAKRETGLLSMRQFSLSC